MQRPPERSPFHLTCLGLNLREGLAFRRYQAQNRWPRAQINSKSRQLRQKTPPKGTPPNLIPPKPPGQPESQRKAAAGGPTPKPTGNLPPAQNTPPASAPRNAVAPSAQTPHAGPATSLATPKPTNAVKSAQPAISKPATTTVSKSHPQPVAAPKAGYRCEGEARKQDATGKGPSCAGSATSGSTRRRTATGSQGRAAKARNQNTSGKGSACAGSKAPGSTCSCCPAADSQGRAGSSTKIRRSEACARKSQAYSCP